MDSSIALKIAKDPESLSEQLDGLLGYGEAVDRLLARHSKASADLLEKLSHSGDRTTLKYVAVNPNATKELRLKMASQFPSWTAAQSPPKPPQFITLPPVYDSPEDERSAKKVLDGDTIRVGQIVVHSKFGEGVVISALGWGIDARAQVDFGRLGTKWLALAIAKIILVE
jgi:hypothetical protein